MQYVAAIAEHVTDRRSAILVVEDSRSDAMLITSSLCEIAATHGLEIVVSTTHGRARSFAMRSLIAVVDATLPDSEPEAIKHFISVIGVPCVVYTRGEYEEGYFGDTPIVPKGDFETLRSVVAKLIDRVTA